MKDFFNIEIFKENPEEGYNFPFILLTPKKINNNTKLIVETNNSVYYIKKDNSVQTFKEQIEDTIEYAKSLCIPNKGRTFNCAYFYQQLNQPILIPIIERCDNEHTDEYYTQMLGRNVVLDKTSKFANLTSQIVKMIDLVKNLYKEQNIKIDDKAALVGTSASGVFAGRLAFAEPQTFDYCLSVCSNAVQPLPFEEINGIKLPYPLGTADYEYIFGKEFDLEEYSKIKQLFIVGEKEDNQKYNIANNPRLHDKKTQKLYAAVYGDCSIQERQKKIDKIIKEAGIKNTNCLVAPGEHSWSGKGNIITSYFNSFIHKNKKNI